MADLLQIFIHDIHGIHGIRLSLCLTNNTIQIELFLWFKVEGIP